MTDSPQSDNQNDDRPTTVTSVSGGVNVDAQRDVTIGGDVVGRDKITSTQNTWNNIRHIIVSPWGLIGLAVIFAVTALIITGVIKLPTPLAFPPASAGQSLIIVADFEDRSGGKYQGIDPAQYIYEQLTAQAKKDNLTVRIERLRHTVDDNTVRPTGETYSATLVLWGWYDALAITPRLERIKTRIDYQSTEEGKHLSLSDPTKVEFSIVTDLPSQSTYLVLFVLGLDAYSDPARGYDEALPYFNSAIESIPTNVAVTANPTEAYYFRGNVYYHKGDYNRAIADYGQAIQLKPDNAAAYYNRGVAYYHKSDTDRAIADFDQAIQLKPDDAEAYVNRGVAYDDKGDTDRAITDYDQAIQLKPDFAEAYNNRGNAYVDKGDYDRAIADFDKVIQLKPDLAETYGNRGIVYANKGDYDRAIADYDKAIQLKPDFAETYYNRGLAYYYKGDTERAIADYDQAIQLKPDYADAYVNRGLAYAGKGDYNRAIADYGKAIQLRPDFADAYYNRGGAYYSKGDTDRALADLVKTIQLQPNDAQNHFGRGLIYALMGEKQKAIADFKKVLELSNDPDLRQQAQDALKALGAQ
jgi:tetratricopeptide (TPR) repeat protein